MRRSASRGLVAVAVAVGLALAGCGQSQEEKAVDQVCSARADIKKQVDTLKGLTVSTATTEQIRTGLEAIREDLSKIGEAQKDLSGQRRQELEAANEAFTSEVKSIASSVGTSVSLSDAKQRLTAALQQLGAAYEQTLAGFDCG